MKSSRRAYIPLYFLALLLIITVIIISSGNVIKQNNFFVSITFIVNILFFYIMLLRAFNYHTYSFDMDFWLFSFFFMGAAPFLQYLTDSYPWNVRVTSEEIVRTNSLLMVFSLFYCIGKNLKNRQKKEIKPLEFDDFKLNILLAISVIITLFMIRKVGFSNLFFQSTNNIPGMGKTGHLIVDHAFKDTILMIFVLFAVQSRQKKKINIKTILAFILFFIVCFPTSLSRNAMAAYYGGIIIFLFDNKRNSRWLSYLIIFGLIFIFPVANIFRYINSFSEINNINFLSIFRNVYLEAHYDAYQMFISIQKYVSRYGLSYGKQLIGAILFFVPRSVWRDKPYGTGQTVFTKLYPLKFSNVSAPLVSESYINFGMIGILLFGIVTGSICKNYDDAYWEGKCSVFYKTRILYPFLLFRFFFLLRGDLMSSSAYLVSQVVVTNLLIEFSKKS